MIWKRVAQGYMESFSRVRSDRRETPRVQFSSRATPKILNQLPELNLNHVNALTDDTGMLQHAIFTIPNRAEGFTTDDNARALMFTVLLEQLSAAQVGADQPTNSEAANPDWPFRYLAFLEHAFNPDKKRFRNFLGYDHRWTEEQGSEDSHGRALWARKAASFWSRRRDSFGSSSSGSHCDKMRAMLSSAKTATVAGFSWSRR